MALDPFTNAIVKHHAEFDWIVDHFNDLPNLVYSALFHPANTDHLFQLCLDAQSEIDAVDSQIRVHLLYYGRLEKVPVQFRIEIWNSNGEKLLPITQNWYCNRAHRELANNNFVRYTNCGQYCFDDGSFRLHCEVDILEEPKPKQELRSLTNVLAEEALVFKTL